ncbi:hypothetical protein [Streptomyces aureocirculatus]|uniref:hypothetical protein n=1 Tax=Streptomyces aureocirculatus TaxID=67275 RepID=UPI000AF29421|nr:hypothetical protein [Streptomyces aureocirculatus]
MTNRRTTTMADIAQLRRAAQTNNSANMAAVLRRMGDLACRTCGSEEGATISAVQGLGVQVMCGAPTCLGVHTVFTE